MAEFPALSVWTDALISDTLHLSNAEFGAYVRLLIVAWRRPTCDLPNDDVFLGKCVLDRRNWHRLKPVLTNKPFFELCEDGFYRQPRLVREREFVSRKVARSAAGGRAKSLKSPNRAPAKQGAKTVLGACSTPAPTPTPISKKANGNDLSSGLAQFVLAPDTDEFKAWLIWTECAMPALHRELKRRVFEGRPFDFESQWPPDGKHA